MKFPKRCKLSMRQKIEICFYGIIGSGGIIYSIWGIISLGQEKQSEWLLPLGISLVMIILTGLAVFKVWKNIDSYISKDIHRTNNNLSNKH